MHVFQVTHRRARSTCSRPLRSLDVAERQPPGTAQLVRRPRRATSNGCVRSCVSRRLLDPDRGRWSGEDPPRAAGGRRRAVRASRAVRGWPSSLGPGIPTRSARSWSERWPAQPASTELGDVDVGLRPSRHRPAASSCSTTASTSLDAAADLAVGGTRSLPERRRDRDQPRAPRPRGRTGRPGASARRRDRRRVALRRARARASIPSSCSTVPAGRGRGDLRPARRRTARDRVRRRPGRHDGGRPTSPPVSTTASDCSRRAAADRSTGTRRSGPPSSGHTSSSATSSKRLLRRLGVFAGGFTADAARDGVRRRRRARRRWCASRWCSSSANRSPGATACSRRCGSSRWSSSRPPARPRRSVAPTPSGWRTSWTIRSSDWYVEGRVDRATLAAEHDNWREAVNFAVTAG